MLTVALQVADGKADKRRASQAKYRETHRAEIAAKAKAKRAANRQNVLARASEISRQRKEEKIAMALAFHAISKVARESFIGSNDRAAMDAETLRSLFEYDHLTGLFIRRVRTARCTRVGDVVGRPNGSGRYIQIKIKEKHYMAHRMAWLYVYGSLPDGEIDHINGIKDDNRICNLRVVSRAVNQQNLRRANVTNGSKFLGVSYFKARNKWKSKIVLGGVAIHLGYFDSPEEAHQAYLAAKRDVHEGCTL